jgi:hypothetical protein
MSPLPTMSIRCHPEHQRLLRDVAAALRTRPEIAAAVAALLAEPGTAPLPMPAPDVAAVLARLETIEHWIAERNTDVTRDATRSGETPGSAAERNTSATHAVIRSADAAPSDHTPEAAITPDAPPPKFATETTLAAPTLAAGAVEAATATSGTTDALGAAGEPGKRTRLSGEAKAARAAEIRRRRDAGESAVTIAAALGISVATVNRDASGA